MFSKLPFSLKFCCIILNISILQVPSTRSNICSKLHHTSVWWPLTNVWLYRGASRQSWTSNIMVLKVFRCKIHLSTQLLFKTFENFSIYLVLIMYGPGTRNHPKMGINVDISKNQWFATFQVMWHVNIGHTVRSAGCFKLEIAKQCHSCPCRCLWTNAWSMYTGLYIVVGDHCRSRYTHRVTFSGLVKK